MDYTKVEDIHEMINLGNIKLAIECMQHKIDASTDKALLSTIQEEYNKLISQYQGDNLDTDFHSALQLIKKELHKMCSEKIIETNNVYQYYTRRTPNDKLSEEQRRFYRFMLQYPSNSTLAEIEFVLDNDDEPWTGKALVLTAVTINLWYRFTPEYFTLLIKHINNSNPHISARAIVGIVTSIISNHRYVLSDKYIYNLLKTTLSESPKEYLFYEAILAYHRSQISEEKSYDLYDLAKMKALKLATQKENDEHIENKRNQDFFMMLQNNFIDYRYESFFQLLKKQPFKTEYKELCNWFKPFDFDELCKKGLSETRKKIILTIAGDSNSSDIDKRMISEFLLTMTEKESENYFKGFISKYNHNILESEPTFDETTYVNLYSRDIYRMMVNYKCQDTSFDSELKNASDFLSQKQMLKIFDNPEQLIRLSKKMAELNLSNDAIKIMTHIQSTLAPNNTENLFNLCKAYSVESDYFATLHYGRMLDLIDENIETKLIIINALEALSEHETARHYYETLIELEPQNYDYKLNYASCLKKLKRYEDATKVIFEVYYHYPEDGICILELISCLEMSRRFDDALSYMEKHKQLYTPEELKYEKIIILIMQGEIKEACKYIRTLSTTDRISFFNTLGKDLRELYDYEIRDIMPMIEKYL